MVSASFLLPGVLKTTQVNCLAMRQCCFECHNFFLGLWNWTSRNLDDNRINWLWLLAIYWNQKKTQIQFKMPMSENDRFVSIPCAPALLLCLPCDRSLLFALFFHYTIIASTQNILAAVYGRARQLNIRAPVCWDLVSKRPRWIALLSVSAVLNLTKVFSCLAQNQHPERII